MSLDFDDRVGLRVEEITDEQSPRVSDMFFDDPRWLCDAAAMALATGDWIGLGVMVQKHAGPLIHAAAELDVSEAAEDAREAEGESRYWDAIDARDAA